MRKLYNREMHPQNRPQTSGLLVILRDVFILCIVLNVFALFHHVLPSKLDPVGNKSASPVSTATPFISSTDAATTSSPESTVQTPVPSDLSGAFLTDGTDKVTLLSQSMDIVKIEI